MMVSKSMKVLNIIAGVLLMALGVYCLCNQDIAAMTAGLMIGVLMLLSGVMEIVVFATTSGFMLGSGWLLLDGVLTVILSLFLLLNQWFTMMSLPFLFTLWLLFSGVSKFANSFELKRLGVRGWGWFTVLGLLLIAAGVISFLDPVAGAVALGAVLGVTLILEGVASILRACFAGRFWM